MPNVLEILNSQLKSLASAVAGLRTARPLPQSTKAANHRIGFTLAADAVLPAGGRQFLESDPQRFLIMMAMDPASDSCYMRPLLPDNAGIGIAIPMSLTTTNFLQIEFCKHGALACVPWEIIANNVNPAFVHVFTTSYINPNLE